MAQEEVTNKAKRIMDKLAAFYHAIEKLVPLITLVVGIVVGRGTMEIQRQRLEIEMQKPDLVYGYSVRCTPVHTEWFYATFFTRVNEYKEEHPSASYIEAVENVSLITTTVKTQIPIWVRNEGPSPATDVHIKAELKDDIAEIAFEAGAEHPEIIEGGKGAKSVLVKVSRLPPDGSISMQLHTWTVCPMQFEITSLDIDLWDELFQLEKLGFVATPPSGIWYRSASEPPEPVIAVYVSSNEAKGRSRSEISLEELYKQLQW
jgi:hypothetical protein